MTANAISPAAAAASDVTPAQWQELDAFITAQPVLDRSALIPVLHKAQEIVGYLPPPVQEHIAKRLGLTPSDVLGVVTFYHFFSMQPRGRHTINVCLGTACYVRGAKKVQDAITDLLKAKVGETTPDRRFSITTQRCFGACGLAPVVMINNETFGRMTPKKLHTVLSSYK